MTLYKINKIFEAMTIPFTLTIMVTDQDKGKLSLIKLAPLVQETLNRIERDYSPFKEDSLVSQYQAGDLTPLLNPEFQAIYVTVRQAKLQTNNLFDPYYKGVYDPTGYVKGWAIEKIFKEIISPLLMEDFVQAICFNGGGDMQFDTKDSSDFRWVIGIESPYQNNTICAQLELKRGAVATSGFSKRGQHIVGRSVIDQMTVVATSLGVADIYATASLVADQKELEWLLKQYRLSGIYIQDHELHYVIEGEEKNVIRISV